MLDIGQLDLAGTTLRQWNQEIKSALIEVGQHPGSLTASEARALHDAQVTYDRLREAYEWVYRSMFADVPGGLNGRRGLGLVMAPIALANPATALVLIVGAIVAGGVAYQVMQIFRDAIRTWRERQAIGAGATGSQIIGSWDSDDWFPGLPNWGVIAGGGLLLILLLRR